MEHLITPLFGETSSTCYKLSNSTRTITTFTRKVSSVGSLSSSAQLFADNIWPGSYTLADFLVEHPNLCAGKNVLELGAGSALPSIVAAVLSAKLVVITDYPDKSIILNLSQVVQTNNVTNAAVLSYEWGQPVDDILMEIDRERKGTLFDLILLAELLWKDTYQLHENLLSSVAQCLCKQSGIAILTFVHRPTDSHTALNDLEFLELAKTKFNLNCKYLGTDRNYKDVFENDAKFSEVHMYALYYCSEIDF